MYDLTFDPEKYEVKTCEFGERKVTYRAFEHIVYCANPVSKVQTLNIYVPECYYEGGEINGYSLHTELTNLTTSQIPHLKLCSTDML